MRYFKRKQVCRLTFFGKDDMLLNGYNTYVDKSSIVDDGNTITKTMEFYVNDLYDIEFSNFAKMVMDNFTFLHTDYEGIIKIRCVNVNNHSDWDSEGQGKKSVLIWSGSCKNLWNNTDVMNYSFKVPRNFVQNNKIRFEIELNKGDIGNQSSLHTTINPTVWYKFDTDPSLLTLKDYGATGLDLDIIVPTYVNLTTKYPEIPLTDDTNAFASSFYNTGESDNERTEPYEAFNGIYNLFWNSWASARIGAGTEIDPYNDITGNATNTYFTAYAGEYLGVELEKPIVLKYFNIFPTSTLARAPRTFRIYGANNKDEDDTINKKWRTDFTDNYWTMIYDHTTPLETNKWESFKKKTFNVPSNNVAYQHYCIVINAVNSGNGKLCHIAEMEYYGAELTQYPPIQTDDTNTFASSYRVENDSRPYNAFDNTFGYWNNWCSINDANYLYTDVGGIATAQKTYFTGYAGEYLGIDLLEEVVVKRFIIEAGGSDARAPRTFRLYGANSPNCKNNLTDLYWTMIHDQTTPLLTADWTAYKRNFFELPNNTASYRYYAIVVNTIDFLNTWTQIGRIIYETIPPIQVFADTINDDVILYPTAPLINNTYSFGSSLTVGDYFHPFDGNINTSWKTGNYTAGVADNTYFTGYAGEYIGIECEDKVLLHHITIQPSRTVPTINSPVLFRIYGANDAQCKSDFTSSYWTMIYDETVQQTGWKTTTGKFFVINSMFPYRYYALVINKTDNTSTEVEINELLLYGVLKPDEISITTGKPAYPLTNAYSWNGNLNILGNLFYLENTNEDKLKQLLHSIKNGFTISFNFYTSDTTNEFIIFVIKSGSNILLQVRVYAGSLLVEIGDGLGNVEFIMTSISQGVWFNFISKMKIDSIYTTVKNYIDDVLVDDDIFEFKPFQNLTDLSFTMGTDYEEETTTGIIQDFRIYDGDVDNIEGNILFAGGDLPTYDFKKIGISTVVYDE